jgi:hypothetical protein
MARNKKGWKVLDLDAIDGQKQKETSRTLMPNGNG